MALRLTSALERDLKAGLAMAARVGIPPLSTWARRFRTALLPSRAQTWTEQRNQLELWLDWTLQPDHRFYCAAQHCSLRYRVCIARQIDTDSHMEDSDMRRKRGKGPNFPGCYTATCRLGEANRLLFGDGVAIGLLTEKEA